MSNSADPRETSRREFEAIKADFEIGLAVRGSNWVRHWARLSENVRQCFRQPFERRSVL